MSLSVLDVLYEWVCLICMIKLLYVSILIRNPAHRLVIVAFFKKKAFVKYPKC